MTDKSPRVKLVIVSLLERNLNQQTSLFTFRSFNSTRKVNIDLTRSQVLRFGGHKHFKGGNIFVCIMF